MSMEFLYTEEDERAGGVTHVVEHLPSKHEALSSNPRTSKKQNKITKDEKQQSN
jgi:hypothetical protein